MFDFQYRLKQWIVGHEVELDIKGVIGVSLNSYTDQQESWGVRLSSIAMDWNKPYVAEQYLFFYVFQAIECYWDSARNLQGRFDVLGQSDLLRHIKNELKYHVQDQQCLKSLNNLLNNLCRNPQFIEQAFKNHPLIKLFVQLKQALALKRKQALIYESVNYDQHTDYFGQGIPLHIKNCWLAKDEPDTSFVLTKVGGLAKEQTYTDDYLQLMVQLQGNALADTTLHVDYADNYVLEEQANHTILQLLYAESMLETIVADIWYKREEIQIHRKEVQYGRK